MGGTWGRTKHKLGLHAITNGRQVREGVKRSCGTPSKPMLRPCHKLRRLPLRDGFTPSGIFGGP